MIEIRKLMDELDVYLDKYGQDYYESWSCEVEKEWEFDKEGKFVFEKFIRGMKEIEPITDEESLKENPKKDSGKTAFLSVCACMGYMVHLLKIKRSILHGKWYDAIEELGDLEHSYDIRKQKIYYAIISLI